MPSSKLVRVNKWCEYIISMTISHVAVGLSGYVIAYFVYT